MHEVVVSTFADLLPCQLGISLGNKKLMGMGYLNIIHTTNPMCIISSVSTDELVSLVLCTFLVLETAIKLNPRLYQWRVYQEASNIQSRANLVR